MAVVVGSEWAVDVEVDIAETGGVATAAVAGSMSAVVAGSETVEAATGAGNWQRCARVILLVYDCTR